MGGSEAHFKIFVQEGSSGTRFDHGQFEIKTFRIYAPTYSTVHIFASEKKKNMTRK